MSISDTSMLSPAEISANNNIADAVVCYFPVLLAMSCIVGYIVCSWATKPKPTVCLDEPATQPSQPKPKKSGNRSGFQWAPPAVQEAIIHLQQGQVKAAVALLQKLPETIAGSVPASAARSILITTVRTPKLGTMMLDLAPLTGKIESGPLEAVITDAVEKKDVAACRQLDSVACALQIPKTQVTFEALAKVYAFDASSLRELVGQAEAPLARPFAKIVLQACTAMKDFKIVTEVFDKARSADFTYLRGVVEKASDGHDTNNIARSSCARSPSTTSAGSDTCSAPTSPRSSVSSEEILRQDSKDVLRQENSSSLKDATRQTKAPAAKLLFHELAENEQGSSASYHGLLNACVNSGDQRGAWRLVADMQVNGISPNAMTCSILLKGKVESVEEVSRVLLLVETIDERMDDVFFMNLAEACIRVGRLDVLSKQFAKIQNKGRAGNFCSQTYGAMITAYGRAHDMKRVWELWRDMLSHKIHHTTITLGSMVGALVANGMSKEAWRLVEDLQKEESCQPLLDAVIYSIILRGFANAGAIDKVVALYAQMKAQQMQPNTVTYNTMLNAFAQSGMMQYVPALLQDMKNASPPLDADIETYNALVKGYCNTGNFDRALRIFKDMQVEGKCMPDEVMFANLLSGCAKEVRPDEAFELLSDMKRICIAPSSCTLCQLVKLMGRCSRLDQAFTMLEDISKEYKLKISIQVSTCLIQACFHNGQVGKAVALYEKIVGDGETLPDAMVYTTLVRGCLRLGVIDQAMFFVRCAHGIGVSNSSPGLIAGCLDEVVQALGGGDSEQARALMQELRS